MSRTAAIPALAAVSMAAFLTAGCLENPGPDKGLDAWKHRAQASMRFQGREFLSLNLSQESGTIFLRTTNVASGPIDSAAFRLEISASAIVPGSPGAVNHVRLVDFYGKVGPLPPGMETGPVGIDSLLSENLADLYIEATLVRAFPVGLPGGHPLGGIYRGRFETRLIVPGGDSTLQDSGPVQAILDVEGAFDISVSGTPTKRNVSGNLAADGSVSELTLVNMYSDNQGPWRTSGFSAGPDALDLDLVRESSSEGYLLLTRFRVKPLDPL